MDDSEALLLLLKYDVDVVACECNGRQGVKVELCSGEVFTVTSFESLLDTIIDQFGSRQPSEPSEICRNLELAIEDCKLDRLQMQRAGLERLAEKTKKKRQKH